MRRRLLAGAALALGLPLSPGPHAAPGARPASSVRPGVVLITVESLRFDRIGCYSGGAKPTPALDALAARGVRFERAYAASPSTAPSVATILTGLYPIHHGLRHDLAAWIDPRVPTIATLLHAAGYRTGAVLGSFHLDADRGLARGFDLYDDAIQGIRKLLGAVSKERRADEVVRKGLGFLDGARSGRPFFLWLDLYDPHYDYDPPDPFKARFDADRYQGEVAAVDAALQTLADGLRARGLEGGTDLILAGSHGEGLDDHQETGHGIYLYETTIRVPLIVVPAGAGTAPPGAAGRVVREAVGLVDLAPTILERAGVAPPARTDGRSLAAILASAAMKTGAPRRLFAEAAQPHAAYGWSPLFAVIEGDHKIVAGRRLEAFALDADPDEAKPLSPVPGWASALEAFGRPLLGSLDPPGELRRKVLAGAAELDLPWRESPICLEKQSWPDPRDRVVLNDILFRARIASDQGLPGSASTMSRNQILPVDPANFSALAMVSSVALRNGDHATLMEELEILQCDYPLRAVSYHYFGHDLQRRKEMAGAEKAFRLCSVIEPRNEEPFYDLAALYALEGKKDLALDYLRRSIERGATDFGFIRTDPQLASLRKDPRFVSLVGTSPSPPSPK